MVTRPQPLERWDDWLRSVGLREIPRASPIKARARARGASALSAGVVGFRACGEVQGFGWVWGGALGYAGGGARYAAVRRGGARRTP